MAPEIVLGKGHGKAVDYWSLGVLLFEMLTGRTPYWEANSNIYDIIQRVNTTGFSFPPGTKKDSNVVLFTEQLLHVDPKERLGAGSEGVLGIMGHCWFEHLDFDLLDQMKLKAPSEASTLKLEKPFVQFRQAKQKVLKCVCTSLHDFDGTEDSQAEQDQLSEQDVQPSEQDQPSE